MDSPSVRGIISTFLVTVVIHFLTRDQAESSFLTDSEVFSIFTNCCARLQTVLKTTITLYICYSIQSAIRYYLPFYSERKIIPNIVLVNTDPPLRIFLVRI